MITAGIVGASGYAGIELVRLLTAHPNIQQVLVSSSSYEGEVLSDLYPSLRGIANQVFLSKNELIETSDIIFAALPHGLSQELAVQVLEQGKKMIDLGADFRLENEEDYQQWYSGTFVSAQLHKQATYGLPELFREQIVLCNLIANPGCYPTATALGIAPLLAAKLVEAEQMIVDAKSGVTGAGRGLTQNTHFPECNEAFGPYSIAVHRHTPEIEQTLSHIAGLPVQITFVPHLLPINRGILCTCYVTPFKALTTQELHQIYTHYYQQERFVRVLPLGETANIKTVKHSNYCDISLHVDERTGRIIVVVVIDNIIKGAAGQAIQNMNLMYGFMEDAGLQMLPTTF